MTKQCASASPMLLTELETFSDTCPNRTVAGLSELTSGSLDFDLGFLSTWSFRFLSNLSTNSWYKPLELPDREAARSIAAPIGYLTRATVSVPIGTKISVEQKIKFGLQMKDRTEHLYVPAGHFAMLGFLLRTRI